MTGIFVILLIVLKAIVQKQNDKQSLPFFLVSVNSINWFLYDGERWLLMDLYAYNFLKGSSAEANLEHQSWNF